MRKVISTDKIITITNSSLSFFKNSTQALLFLIVSFSFVSALNYGKYTPGIDFYQFWAVGLAIEQLEINNIYSNIDRKKMGSELYEKERKVVASNHKLKFPDNLNKKAVPSRQLRAATIRKVLETYSTPFLYATFHLFSSGNYDVDIQRYLLFSLVSFLLAILTFCKLLRYSSIATMAMIAVFMGWFEPFLSDVRVGNVNQIQLGLLALFMYFQSKRVWRPGHHFIGGLILGFAVMFKPNLVYVIAMLVVSWVINQRYRKLAFELAGILTAAVIAFMYGSVFFGSPQIWVDWLVTLKALPDDIIAVDSGNYAFARLISDWSGVNISFFLTILFAGLITLLTWKNRRSTNEIRREREGNQGQKRALHEDMLMVASGGLIYLLSAPLVWIHYIILVIPITLFVFRPRDSSQPVSSSEIFTQRIIPIVAIIGLSMEPVRFFDISTPVFVAISACASILLLFGLALLELHHLKKINKDGF